jgi:hypothetical protein
VHGWSRDRFCEYLRGQRERASLSIEDIARVTKIPERSLRQIEAGQFEDLPADVFVRGFLRSYARVVGLNADDVVRRYAMCGLDPAPVASELAQVAAEQIAALAERDPAAGDPVVMRPPSEPPPPTTSEADREPVIDSGIDEVRTASAPVRNHGSKKKRKRRGHHASGSTRREAAPPPSVEPSPIVEETPAIEAAPAVPGPVAARQRAFLPPTWSEAHDTGRRGPLTLAVIVLVIVATLTMSYLLRRPTYSGDGVTVAPAAAANRA